MSPVTYTGTADIPFQAGKSLRQIEMEKESYTRGTERAELELRKEQIEQNRIERELEREWREKQETRRQVEYEKEFELKERALFPEEGVLPSGYTPTTELGGVTPRIPAKEQRTTGWKSPSLLTKPSGVTRTSPFGYGWMVPTIGKGFPMTYKGVPVSGGGVPGAAVREIGELERPAAMTRGTYKTYQKQLAKHWWDIKKGAAAAEKSRANLEYKKQKDAMANVLKRRDLSLKEQKAQMKAILDTAKFRLEEKKYEEEVSTFEKKERIKAGLKPLKGFKEKPVREARPGYVWYQYPDKSWGEEPSERFRERKPVETPEERRVAARKEAIAREKRTEERKKATEATKRTRTEFGRRWKIDPDTLTSRSVKDPEETAARASIKKINAVLEEEGSALRYKLVPRKGVLRGYQIIGTYGEAGPAREIAPVREEVSARERAAEVLRGAGRDVSDTSIDRFLKLNPNFK